MIRVVWGWASRIVGWILKVQLTRYLKKNPQVMIVGVTGSVGKTTTKLAIAKVLEQRFKVLAHPGNYNSETGVPLAIFELESPGSVFNVRGWMAVVREMNRRLKRPLPYEVIVQELGAGRRGDIRYFSFLKPRIGVVTAAKPAHLKGFGSIEAIVDEKFSLAEISQLALVNAEEERFAPKLATMEASKLHTYGTSKGEYRYSIRSYSAADGFEGTLVLGEERVDASARMVGRHMAEAVAAAAAVGALLGMTPDEIKAGVERIQPVAGRMSPLEGLNGSLILDDSYNASPEAMMASLDTLYERPGRKIAILGGMNELGSDGEKYYRQIGGHCARLDLLVTVAKLARQYVEPARAAGLGDDKVRCFDTPYEAGEFVAGLLKHGDTVLVKGSQGGIFCEEATAKLLANPADTARLVRQSPDWMRQKAHAFSHKRQST
ncbi:UDP-N-acetylmuramoyl-tripeptide--D-alanyl-D-alanine ligase [Corallococcus exercitus]|uniref:UDP-N-acetylmuramoyl-tripeptide--D-alanyl-D-alanine ligase n=1 Tax=Corallococcus exercitus TaxID=2316736 RepID=A0A7Y4JYN2_9BACT|nr:UDP-N-acetylmuramoyl-tripeptide--D-alanyl-D-alanine ligase [Corallococcus exercitus]NOK13610.1 UDP-N-acetylmuramoyl-tripeptide--D-alanyl-D-alanine ligase [Corallococcus exercitus]